MCRCNITPAISRGELAADQLQRTCNEPSAALHGYVGFAMTLDEFARREWMAGMKCFYDGHHRTISAVNFGESLIGLLTGNDDDHEWVRCENVDAVTYPQEPLTT